MTLVLLWLKPVAVMNLARVHPKSSLSQPRLLQGRPKVVVESELGESMAALLHRMENRSWFERCREPP
jgi:hypothetical protein